MSEREKLTAGEFVRGTRIVIGRELEAYFDSPIAYIYAAVFLVLSCTTEWKDRRWNVLGSGLVGGDKGQVDFGGGR